MFIQKCKNCSKEFKWKDIIKQLCIGYMPIECENCKTKHYLNFTSRLIFAFSIPLPYIATTIFKDFFRTLKFYALLIYLTWPIAIICLAPFYSRYHIKNKSNNIKT